jgi:hypothetical protein
MLEALLLILAPHLLSSCGTSWWLRHSFKLSCTKSVNNRQVAVLSRQKPEAHVAVRVPVCCKLHKHGSSNCCYAAWCTTSAISSAEPWLLLPCCN